MLDDLLLLRLLCARADTTADGSITRSRVSSDLHALAGDPAEGAAHWRETFSATVGRMAAAGCLTAEGRNHARLRLTDAGEQRARTAFDVPSAASYPATARWSHWRDQFALPKAAGSKQPLDSDGLRALMLLRFYLPEVHGHVASGLRAAVDLLLTKKIATKATPAALRAAALRAWIVRREEKPAVDSRTESAPDPSESRTGESLPTDLAAFATLVCKTGERCATGRYGDGKIFISHVWRALEAEGRFAPGQESEFKAMLVRANTAGLLRLSHADLADVHEQDDVAASETRYLSERFHFLQIG